MGQVRNETTGVARELADSREVCVAMVWTCGENSTRAFGGENNLI